MFQLFFKFMFKSLTAALVVVSLMPAAADAAYSRRSFSENRSERLLTVAGGMVRPSPQHIFYGNFNPAGLITQMKTGIQTHGYTPQGSLSPITAGASVIFTDEVGGAAGGGGFQAASDGTSSQLVGGMAYLFRPIRTAFGVTANYNVTSRTVTGDFGLIVNPDGILAFGFGVYNFGTGGGLGFGAGVDWELADIVHFVVDGGFNSNFRGLTLKPGFGIILGSWFHFTMGYGFSLDPAHGNTIVSNGITAGVAFKIGYQWSLSYQYRLLGDHLASIAFLF